MKPPDYDSSGITRETARCPACPPAKFNLGRMVDEIDGVFECGEGHGFVVDEDGQSRLIDSLGGERWTG
jgi:hypothetical protein